MKQALVDIKGKEAGEVELNEKIFASKVNPHAIYEAIKNALANKRRGTADTLTRGEVNGSTRKPWRQKGTGRARVGSAKSPLWKGRGIIFGPHPRDYRYHIPQKVRQRALFSVFSKLREDKKLKIIEDFTLDKYSTKEMDKTFTSISSKKKVMFILNDNDKENYQRIQKSCSNLPWLKVVNSKAIEIKDLFYSKEVILTKSSVKELNKRYGSLTP